MVLRGVDADGWHHPDGAVPAQDQASTSGWTGRRSQRRRARNRFSTSPAKPEEHDQVPDTGGQREHGERGGALALRGQPQEREERDEDRDEPGGRDDEERQQGEPLVADLVRPCGRCLPLAEGEDDRAVDGHDREQAETEDGLPGDRGQDTDRNAEDQSEDRHAPPSAHGVLPGYLVHRPNGRSSSSAPDRLRVVARSMDAYLAMRRVSSRFKGPTALTSACAQRSAKKVDGRLHSQGYFPFL